MGGVASAPMLRPWPLLAALFLVPACNCGEEAPPEGSAADAAAAPETSVPADASVLQAVESLGDEGALIVVLRPSQWAGLHGALASWLARLPSEAEPLRQAKTGADLPDLLAYPMGMPAGSLTLTGWDPSRPIVASLGEVPYRGVPGMVTPSLPVLDGMVSSIRHQVLVPATDPAALIAALAGVLERSNGKAQPELVEGRTGARAVRIEQMSVAMLPVDAAVRVVIFDEGVMPDAAKRLAAMRERLDPTPASPVATPALSLLGQPDAVAAAWVRPWRMRPLAAVAGSVQMLRAVATVAADDRSKLLARGTQIVLASELLMTDAGAEVDDMTMALVVDEGTVRLRTAMSLTPEGEAIFDAGAKGAGDVLAAASSDAWVDVSMRADLRAMLDATEPPPAFARASRPGEIAEAIMEGGFFTTTYIGLRHPLGLLRMMEGFAKKEDLPLPIDTLPIAAHLLWRGQSEQGPKVVLAVHWPKDYVDRPLAAMVPLAKGERGFESLRLDTTTHGGKPVTVFGLGGESSSAFDSERTLDGDAFMQARVSLSKLGSEFARDDEVGALLAGSGEVVTTWEHRGRALLAEVAWSPSGSAVEAKPVPVDQGSGWTSPLGSTPGGKGAGCLGDAGRSLSGGLSSTVMVSEDALAAVLAKGMAESEASLGCAEQDEATAEAAAKMRAMVVRLGADALMAAHQGEAAVALLEQQCTRSKNPEICARKTATEALPRPGLPTVELSAECSPPYGIAGGDVDVRIDAKGISLNGVIVAVADVPVRLKAALDASEASADMMGLAIDEAPPVEGSDEGRRASVGLAIDEAVDMARVRPLLQAISEQKVTRLVVSTKTDVRGHQAISIRLAARPPETSEGTKPESPLVLPSTKGIYGMKGSPKLPENTIIGMMADPSMGDSWALLEVGPGTVTSRSTLQPEPQVHAAPSVSALRDAMDGSFTVYVHGVDGVAWKDVAQAIGATCDRATLVVDLPRP